MLRQLTNTKNNLIELSNYLKEVEHDFGIPLNQKISICEYTLKLLKWGKVLGIAENGQTVATIAFYCNDTINKTAYLSLLTTKKIARGKGYAKILIREMISICSESNMDKICCDSVNPIAIKLYKSLGFKEIKKETIDTMSKTYMIYNINK